MNTCLRIVLLIIFTLPFYSLITRHDVADEKYIELAKQYPQICHLPMGEAALIDSCWAITAGHVGNDLIKDIANGYSPSLKCNGTEYAVAKVFVHPGFRDIENGLQNDIALIRINGVIRDVVPAMLYKTGNETGQKITLVGMGDMGTGITGPQKWDKVTRAATNRIDGVEQQWLYFAFDAKESANVTELEGISGPGDSGGPAFIDKDGKRYIAGISSHQTAQEKYGKRHYGLTEYYARISTYTAWINEVLAAKE